MSVFTGKVHIRGASERIMSKLSCLTLAESSILAGRDVVRLEGPRV